MKPTSGRCPCGNISVEGYGCLGGSGSNLCDSSCQLHMLPYTYPPFKPPQSLWGWHHGPRLILAIFARFSNCCLWSKVCGPLLAQLGAFRSLKFAVCHDKLLTSPTPFSCPQRMRGSCVTHTCWAASSLRQLQEARGWDSSVLVLIPSTLN